ncbi:MAG TPA: hypothetical protein VFG46_30020 [Chryseolinea sp.]|nr:hypothetical protein [Chryseolinea sp.]
MTGSVALDVVIGLVFIYLLYSLLATVICEIVATYWGLRARNLLYAIGRMLEDSPKQSEIKILAIVKQIKDDVIRLFDTPEGPASCVFYRLPVIKYLAKNTFHSKPSYITKQTFSKALIEIFRHYGGDEAASDLEKIRNVLNGSLEHKGALKLIRDEIVKSTEGKGGQAEPPPKYDAIYDKIVEIVKMQKGVAPADPTQAKLMKKIRKLLKNPDKIDKDKKKAIVYEIDEMLNLFGHETRSHLRSLLEDANDDLPKFRLNLEQWFDDTMDRAAGWYKQRVQSLLLFIGLAFAVIFNANTIDMVHKLSVDKDARDKMVQLASDYLNDSDKVVANANQPVNFKIDSTQLSTQLDSLRKVQARLQKQIEEANTLLGAGWPELPDSLPLLNWTQHVEDSVSKLSKEGLLGYSIITLDTLIKASSSANVKIIFYPSNLTKSVLGCITENSLWESGERYKGFDRNMTKIKVSTGRYGSFLYLTTSFFSKAFWGFLLTAIAISLGAPFWFDLLNKLMQIRGSVREPTHSATSTTIVSVSDSGQGK